MNLRTKTILRSWARRVGILPALAWIRLATRPAQSDYESAFSSALFDAVHKGDCVWDVGANIGFYAKQLKDRVGPTGVVCAFEPEPHCFAVLSQNAESNMLPFNLALGDREDALWLNVAPNPLGSTHSLVSDDGESGQRLEVRVARGDDLLREYRLPFPQVIKIDVEGFEEEVLHGLNDILGHRECQAVFCEVHFGILDRRGQRHAPFRIEKKLQDYGFNTRWVDSSHLMGRKNPCSVK